MTPIPFYILCGTLGAGKTTLLMRLLTYWKDKGLRTGVLMNEAGEVSIDGPRAGIIAEQVMNLAGGCVCCDTKEDLSWGIAQLVQDHKAEVIILECSGLADPTEVIDAVTDLYTAKLADLTKVIAVLHPISGNQESLSDFVTTQAIRCADELILNKHDLYVSGHWEGFKNSILKQNPFARIWEASQANVDLISLLRPIARISPITARNVTFGVPQTTISTLAPYHPIATTIQLSGPLNAQRFFHWMHTLPPQLERAKGFFRFVQQPELQEFQYAPPSAPTVTPIMLVDEPTHAIVLIGRNYNQPRYHTALLECLDDNTGGKPKQP